MKTTCLLFLTISCAALLHGTDCAAQSSQAYQQTSTESAANTAGGHPRDGERAAPADDGKHRKDGKPSDEQRDHHQASEKNDPRSRASLIKATRPKQLPSSRNRPIPVNAMNLHQPGSAKSSRAAKDGLIQNETVNNALPVRLPSVVRPTVRSLNNVRHRSPNPAIVGGLGNSNIRNTGAIDGAHMNRRP